MGLAIKQLTRWGVVLERQKRNISLNGFISWLEVKIIE
jgi:hypothetical protein